MRSMHPPLISKDVDLEAGILSIHPHPRRPDETFHHVRPACFVCSDHGELQTYGAATSVSWRWWLVDQRRRARVPAVRQHLRRDAQQVDPGGLVQLRPVRAAGGRFTRYAPSHSSAPVRSFDSATQAHLGGVQPSTGGRHTAIRVGQVRSIALGDGCGRRSLYLVMSVCRWPAR